jgi:hypothetical protein
MAQWHEDIQAGIGSISDIVGQAAGVFEDVIGFGKTGTQSPQPNPPAEQSESASPARSPAGDASATPWVVGAIILGLVLLMKG